MKKLIEITKSGEAVIALYTAQGQLRTLNERGIRPLLLLLEETAQPLQDAIVADKVVGKAAAFLFVLGKIRRLHAGVLSVPAKAVLEAHKIDFTYDALTDKILNRDKTGFCPMETKVLNIDTPEAAYEVLR